MTFETRYAAGEQLAERLDRKEIRPDRVFGIPRGGLPVARPVADHFAVPLDVVIASKLGAPNNPELALGAVAADGSLWLNDELVSRLSVSEEYIDRTRAEEAEAAQQKAEQYPSEAVGDLSGLTVVLVDDGVATGATARACLRQLQAAGADRVVLAVPVAPVEVVAELQSSAEEVVVIETPQPFVAVGHHFRDFTQVTDEEAIEYLEG